MAEEARIASLSSSPRPDAAGNRRLAVAVGFILLAGLVIFTARDVLTVDRLREEQHLLAAFVDRNYVAAVAVYLLAYAVLCACAVPGTVLLTIAGGLIFSPLVATVYVAASATTGAIALYLITRYAATDWVRARTGPWAARLEAGFRRDAWSYMFILRLVPLFPFVMINLASALLRVPFKVYAIGTLFGVMPGTFVYATLGAGIGDVLAMGDKVDLAGALLQPTVIGSFVGLAVLAVVPLAYKRLAGAR